MRAVWLHYHSTGHFCCSACNNRVGKQIETIEGRSSHYNRSQMLVCRRLISLSRFLSSVRNLWLKVQTGSTNNPWSTFSWFVDHTILNHHPNTSCGLLYCRSHIPHKTDRIELSRRIKPIQSIIESGQEPAHMHSVLLFLFFFFSIFFRMRKTKLVRRQLLQ